MIARPILKVLGWGLVAWGILQIAFHLWTVFGFARTLGHHTDAGSVAGAVFGPMPYFLIWLAVGAVLLLIAGRVRPQTRLEGKI